MKCGSCFCISKDAPTPGASRDLVENQASEAQSQAFSTSSPSEQRKPIDSQSPGGTELYQAESKLPAFIVNQYEISEVLGEGAQAIVW